jgi:hypothetical protein
MKRILSVLWTAAVLFLALALILNWRVLELEAMDGWQPIEQPAPGIDLIARTHK